MRKIFAVLCAPILFSSLSHAQSTAIDSVSRIDTTRANKTMLTAPKNVDDTFSFVVFADRTSGLPEGLHILEKAVHDANRLKPAFVMNVGDMVQGYCGTEQWTHQMTEFKEIMNQLESPWFPTAGNHDVYGGSEAKTLPKEQNESSFETHFGPLWYAFEYQNNWFIVLFTDEGNPETGEKAFRKPGSQTMSEEQFNWLKSVLNKAKSADGVYVFLHQPRWFAGQYGNDWEKVHSALVEAGNVKVVFGGHVHTLTFNEKDGIQYLTLAVTGAGKNLDAILENRGEHHLYLVTVKKDTEPAIAILPVGAIRDYKAAPPRPLSAPVPADAPQIRNRNLDANPPLVPLLTPQTAP